MGQVWLLSKVTFKEGVRNRILLGIILVAVLFSAFNLIFSQMFAHDISKVSVDLGLSTVSLSGLAIIFFMGINLLTKDFEKRTIYMILSRPLARWQYILGKFFGLSLMVGTSVIILGFVVAAGVKLSMLMAPAFIPENYSWHVFVLSIGFIYLSLMILTALSQLFTCLTTSSYIALLLTVCTYFIGQNVELMLKSFLSEGEMNIAYSYFIEIITWIIPNLQAFDMKAAAGYGLPLEFPALIWVALYGLCYIGVILGLTISVFHRRELS